jgi:DNA-binding NtrC family response regulator
LSGSVNTNTHLQLGDSETAKVEKKAMATGITNQRDTQQTSVSAKCRILLVDEDSNDLRFYRMILEDRGFEVAICNSFEDGIECLESRSFDLIMVGQGSRSFEGRKVVEQALSLDRHTPVLVITRCIDMDCYLEAMQLGALDYLEKPLTPAQIVRLAEQHLRHSNLSARESAA